MPAISWVGSMGWERSGRSSASQWLDSKRKVSGAVPSLRLMSVWTWARRKVMRLFLMRTLRQGVKPGSRVSWRMRKIHLVG
ncbi:MAG: hypothetical protein QE274_03560 [Verrucomicrobiaceae bacterium]|nr:hypothetical protein [Verrucomicrobiaceae bacterium]